MGKENHEGCHRFIDMWALPGIHPSNVELLQQLKTADTQHFTKNMDVVGTVSEKDIDSGDWQKTHLVGLRTDIWRADEDEMNEALDILQRKRKKALRKKIKSSGRLNSKQTERLEEKLASDHVMQMQSDQIESRRLVLKLFKNTGTRMRWCGTIEEITTTEVHNSIGSKRSLLTMVVILPRSQMVTYVQQNHRTFRLPAIFTFGYFDDERMWNVTLKRHWLSLGADFDVEADGEEMGMVDGKMISFGSDSHLRLHPHALSGDTQFADLLTLFTASVGYHRAMRKSVERRVAAAQAGQWHRHVIEDEELRLRHNGRAAA